ncbi:hypothetical protein GCM10007940_00370 [Portibacter lacus]|uniref:Uncharacterized protein n=2 Tax=Portibacter lacus TaxID=1099794 RepID=A0AA37SK56_9BACT|nr:hypothetical protein GCM10007940_00370 [Portibacter lacus]
MNLSIQKFAKMPTELGECSGLIYLNEKLIINNDGGGGPYLHLIDPSTKDTLGRKLISGAMNRDWEAITYYKKKNEILIGDIGNNLGQRKDLNIYHVDASTFQLNKTVSVVYPDQTSFDVKKHNFDCEAMIVKNDNYLLFTKNRGNKNTNIYTAPIYTSEFVFLDSIPLEGMVTDAYYHEESDQVLLLCYQFVFGGFKNSLVILKPTSEENFKVRSIFNIKPAEQIESITHFKDNKFLIGSETGFGNGRHLYIVTIEGF